MVNEEEQSFGVSGKLWHGVLVMFDRDTNSLWTQLDGRAIRGEQTGVQLVHVPSVFTTWSAWLAAHPDTLVLEKDATARSYSSSRYADYLASPDDLAFEQLGAGLGDVIAAKEVVFGVQVGDDSVAIPESTLRERKSFALEVGGRSVVLLRNPATGGVTATADGAGLRVSRSFWYAWKCTHPGSRAVR